MFFPEDTIVPYTKMSLNNAKYLRVLDRKKGLEEEKGKRKRKKERKEERTKKEEESEPGLWSLPAHFDQCPFLQKLSAGSKKHLEENVEEKGQSEKKKRKRKEKRKREKKEKEKKKEKRKRKRKRKKEN